jgi:uncharacterized repeat protein (TIGR04138 family)
LAEQLNLDWKAIRQKAGPYPQEAFQFVRDGLQHTVKTIHGEGGAQDHPESNDRHVSGAELCMGLRDYALGRYGMLARTVLARWRIVKTDDFGRIVFAMIDAGLMRKSDEDCFEDFCGVYEFDEAFHPSEVC